MAEVRHLAVNWVDGMKISRQHFTETDHYHTDQLRLGLQAGLTTLTYGLLPPDTSESLSMQVLGDTSRQVRIEVHTCRAIMPNGMLLNIREEDGLRLDTAVPGILEQYHLPDGQPYTFYIVIAVDPFKRQITGKPLDSEVPVRHPYTIPACTLSLVPSGFVNAGQWSGSGLLIGKIDYANTELHVVHEFIPACTTVKSHKNLREWYNKAGTLLSDIETASFRILQKIRTKNQKSTLSDSIQVLVEKLVNVLAMNQITFQRLSPSQPPACMVVQLVQVAGSIRSVLECLTEREKEEVLGYLGEWADDTPGSLEKQVLSVLQVPYEHNEALPCLQTIGHFLEVWAALFIKLSQLEFIGKRKGQQVFIIESPVQDPPQQDKPRPRWSPI
ncbi:hypothetical protein [Dyadobacter sandarakinus]|uniref:Type VI secretion system baseplate subunit TssK n=1 Tax=Dyadobacter sandarakinus TaxID=2747268 RepID=A0ABX7IAK0_9BACT|nr:hypothetical protein [Dyadobacter sandarakinus]QRR03005.1 hypothetical protein HWI92_19870 [Dyadobacter sandarakinus]